MPRAKLAKKLQPVHAWHKNVRQENIIVVSFQAAESLRAAEDAVGFPTIAREHGLNEFVYGRVVINNQETVRRRERIASEWVETEETTTWSWATTLTKGQLSTRGLWRSGHDRWDIENNGFNVLSTHWGLDHCFKHTPEAIVNFLLTAFIALGFWLWTVFFPPPEKIIRTELREIAVCASFSSGEGAISSAASVEKLSDYFAPDVKVHVDGMETGDYTLDSRDEITQAAYAVRSQLATLEVKFVDINVALGVDKESASADLTARVNARGQNDYIISELRFSFKKIDGQWLIVRVDTVKTLS